MKDLGGYELYIKIGLLLMVLTVITVGAKDDGTAAAGINQKFTGTVGEAPEANKERALLAWRETLAIHKDETGQSDP